KLPRVYRRMGGADDREHRPLGNPVGSASLCRHVFGDRLDDRVPDNVFSGRVASGGQRELYRNTIGAILDKLIEDIGAAFVAPKGLTIRASLPPVKPATK